MFSCNIQWHVSVYHLRIEGVKPILCTNLLHWSYNLYPHRHIHSKRLIYTCICFHPFRWIYYSHDGEVPVSYDNEIYTWYQYVPSKDECIFYRTCTCSTCKSVTSMQYEYFKYSWSNARFGANVYWSKQCTGPLLFRNAQKMGFSKPLCAKGYGIKSQY